MPFDAPRGSNVARLLVVLVLLDGQLWLNVAAEHDTAALHRAQRSARAAAGETETYLLVYDVRHDSDPHAPCLHALSLRWAECTLSHDA